VAVGGEQRTEGGETVTQDRRSGTEPRTARSALRLRLLLSGIALPLAVIATIYFGIRAARTGETVWTVEAVIVGAVAVIALIDLVVIVRRLRARR